MNGSKKNIGLNNGWILCPSKSFPGKFYYFNVLNGETAWSLNDADKKSANKYSTIPKVTDKSHDYPEPTTVPNDSSIISCKVGANTKQPDYNQTISLNQSLPIFGQPAFNKYSGNVEPLMSNIVWTPVQLPIFCQPPQKEVFDKITQTSEIEQNLFIQHCEIPLSKRFKNYENPLLRFDKTNKIINKPENIFLTSTPKSFAHIFENKAESQQSILKSKSWIKEPILKFEPKLPSVKIPEVNTDAGKTVLKLSNKFENTMADNKLKVQAEDTLENLDKTDLRFLLLAKRRKSVDAAVEKKKFKLSEVTPKRVTFNLNGHMDEDTSSDDKNVQEDFTPFTPNHTRSTIDPPKTQRQEILKEKSQLSSLNSTFTDPTLPTLKITKTVPTAVKNDVWYIVADTDVLLIDYKQIDQLVLSDSNCRLLIPYAVRMDIEGLCIGDCNGQQRVINARQLTRRLVTPPRHYKVEPAPADKDTIAVTSQSILNCCIQAMSDNCHVVLITNDPHLQSIAKSLNIPSYKLTEIQNGVDIKPEMTSQYQKYQYRNSTEEHDKFSPCLQNDSTHSFGLFSDLNCYDTSPVNTVNKQLFINNGTDNYDKLINITKPKNNESITKYDSDSTYDIIFNVKNLNLKNKHILESHSENRNPHFGQNCINFEKNIQNSNSVFNGDFENSDFEKTFPKPRHDVEFQNSVISQLNHEINKFQNESLNNNAHTEKLFSSISTTKTSLSQNSNYANKSKMNLFENSDIQMNSSKIPSKHEACRTSRESQLLNPTQARIRKMFTSLNSDSTTNNHQINQDQIKTIDATGLFKVPPPVEFKNRTRTTSALVERAPSTDLTRRIVFENTKSIDEIIRRFRVKSKHMSEKISSRIDEWICSYMQIMEDILNSLLQKNSECMKNTVAPLTLHDTLNCIKMVYDSHANIRKIIDSLEELLNKCVCVKGKLKTSLKPDDFMTMFGYGMLLVQSLQDLLPSSEDLKEAESHLASLLNTIENTSTELDPDLFKTVAVSRSDVDSEDEEFRPNYLKEPSYVMNYLKKHFKDWASHKEDLQEHNNLNKPQYHSDFTVVRTNGKNLNLLKINSSKTISLNEKTAEDNGANKPKVTKLYEINQQKNSENGNVNIDERDKKEAGPKLMKQMHKDDNIVIVKYVANDNIDIKKLTKENELSELTTCSENVDHDTRNKNKIIDDFDITNQKNTARQIDETTRQIDETAGPKMIRNYKLIDEYEKKIENREILDLDLLDYSEIYEPSVTENVEFDDLCENNDNCNDKINENVVNNDNDNNGLTNKTCTLQDFTEDINLGDHEDFYAVPSSSYDFESKNEHCITETQQIPQYNTSIDENTKNKDENDHIQNDINMTDNTYITKSNVIESIDKINCAINKDASKNEISRNDSCIDFNHSCTYTDNSENRNDNSAIHNDKSEIHNDNSRQINDNVDNTSRIVQDDSTNDSGFENDSTYAYSVVKILLKELSTSFIVIYQFVKKFVDEIHHTELCESRKNVLHNQASKSLEDMVAIIDRLKSIIKRESAEDTVLKTLLLKAGLEATTNKRVTRYRQIVMKSLEQAQILENALKIIVSTTIGDFDALSTNAQSVTSNIRYFNIFE